MMDAESLNSSIGIFNYPSDPGPAGGLQCFDRETLRRYVDPIWRSLKTLDAETMLSLQRMEWGARLDDR
jgi:hypothetical protein